MHIKDCLEKADRSAGLDCPHTRKLKVLPSTVLSTEPAGPSAPELSANVDFDALPPFRNGFAVGLCLSLQALLDERHGHLSYTAAQNPTVIHRLTRCKVTDPPEPDTAPVNPEFYSNILVCPHGRIGI